MRPACLAQKHPTLAARSLPRLMVATLVSGMWRLLFVAMVLGVLGGQLRSEFPAASDTPAPIGRPLPTPRSAH
jgi:hypothetical protein